MAQLYSASLVLVHVMFKAGDEVCKTQTDLTGCGEEGPVACNTRRDRDHNSKFTTEQQQHALC